MTDSMNRARITDHFDSAGPRMSYYETKPINSL